MTGGGVGLTAVREGRTRLETARACAANSGGIEAEALDPLLVDR